MKKIPDLTSLSVRRSKQDPGRSPALWQQLDHTVPYDRVVGRHAEQKVQRRDLDVNLGRSKTWNTIAKQRDGL